MEDSGTSSGSNYGYGYYGYSGYGSGYGFGYGFGSGSGFGFGFGSDSGSGFGSGFDSSSNYDLGSDSTTSPFYLKWVFLPQTKWSDGENVGTLFCMILSKLRDKIGALKREIIGELKR